MSNIELECSGGIATLTLSRPPLNALSVAMMRELIDRERRRRDGANGQALMRAFLERK